MASGGVALILGGDNADSERVSTMLRQCERDGEHVLGQGFSDKPETPGISSRFTRRIQSHNLFALEKYSWDARNKGTQVDSSLAGLDIGRVRSKQACTAVCAELSCAVISVAQ